MERRKITASSRLYLETGIRCYLLTTGAEYAVCWARFGGGQLDVGYLDGNQITYEAVPFASIVKCVRLD